MFLKPQFSPFRHRSEAKVDVTLNNKKYKLPVVPANMKCVMDVDRSRWMSKNDYFYIMHRFGNKNSITHEEMDIDNKDFVLTANEEKWKTISMSIGVNQLDKDFLKWCIDYGLRLDFITVDIAHGHSISMQEMLSYIKGLDFVELPTDRSYTPTPEHYRPYVIAGNVATAEATDDLYTWGADMVKVGIAQGGACTTFGKTGFGSPMFTTLLECASVEYVPIIADGGIRTNGDIAKALVAGATLVMAGSIFAATKDSPAEDIYGNAYVAHSTEFGPRDVKGSVTHKAYYGSASEYNTHCKHHIEGTLIKLPVDRWTYAEKLFEIEEDLQSSKTYSGGNFNLCKWGTRTA